MSDDRCGSRAPRAAPRAERVPRTRLEVASANRSVRPCDEPGGSLAMLPASGAGSLSARGEHRQALWGADATRGEHRHALAGRWRIRPHRLRHRGATRQMPAVLVGQTPQGRHARPDAVCQSARWRQLGCVAAGHARYSWRAINCGTCQVSRDRQCACVVARHSSRASSISRLAVCQAPRAWPVGSGEICPSSRRRHIPRVATGQSLPGWPRTRLADGQATPPVWPATRAAQATPLTPPTTSREPASDTVSHSPGRLRWDQAPVDISASSARIVGA